MVGHGGSSAGSYLADPTSPIPSHCASIVMTSTVRVKLSILLHPSIWHAHTVLLYYVYISHVHSCNTERALLFTQDMSCMFYMVFPSISMPMEHARKPCKLHTCFVIIYKCSNSFIRCSDYMIDLTIKYKTKGC